MRSKDEIANYLYEKGKDLSPVEIIAVAMGLMSFRSKEWYDQSVKYSKKYFANYYGVDIKTINTWFKIYISEFSSEKIFTPRQRWEITLKKLGKCDKIKLVPRSRIGLIEFIQLQLKETKGKKSAKYHKYEEEFEEFFIRKEEKALNKFPPSRCNEFISRFIDWKVDEYTGDSQTNFTPELICRIVEEEIDYYLQMTFEQEQSFNKKVRHEVEIIRNYRDSDDPAPV